MTRARIIPQRFNVPSYYEHAARLTPQGHIIMGPHFDLDPEDLDCLRDPFKIARRFAHAFALELGEPFAWGWYETPEGARPAVCAADVAWRFIRVNGSTERA